MALGPNMLYRLRVTAMVGAVAMAGGVLPACSSSDEAPEAQRAAPVQTDEDPDDVSGFERKDGNGGKSAKASAPSDRSPGGVSADTPSARGSARLSGDRDAARSGLEAARGVYGGFAKAVDAGVAATDVAVRKTLDKAQTSESLVGVCDFLSVRARRDTVRYAKASAGLADVDWTCEKAVGLMLRRSRQSGGLKRSLSTRVVGVNAQGDRATATIRLGADGPITSVPLVRESGEWKLAATPATPR